ncbi:MAG TPA: hypothetical protein VKT70_13840 [Stellaceae bacterium]|nr:hypothetical protein [Stellaceae bacterium]
MKEIEIFRAGRHQAMNGRTLHFGAHDLQATASAYNPAQHEAPAVIGHPAHDAPAYAWVKGLHARDDRLFAELHEVDPAFAKLVKAGRFKKISVAFYEPAAPANPSPGVYALRHVGFLGAQPPAVKGLKPVAFAGNDADIIAFSDDDDDDDWDDDKAVKSLLRRLKDYLLGADNDDDDDDDDDDDKSAAALYAERAADLARREHRLIRAENTHFIDGLVRQGKLLPAQKEHVALFLEQMGSGDSAGLFKNFLAERPPLITFGEVAAPEAPHPSPKGVEVAPGAVVDRARLELHLKALAFMEAHKEADYITAITAVGGN